MNTQKTFIDKYIEDVLGNIQAPESEKGRIEADLRGYFQSAEEAGEALDETVARLGSPGEIAAAYMAQMTLEYAGFWPRLFAFAIDMAVILLVGGGLAFLGVGLANQVPQHPEGYGYLLGGMLILLVAGCTLAALGMIVLYFPILEGRFGQTLGKKLLHLRVLKEDGLPADYKETFLRRISYYFELLPLDALFIPFNAKKQRAFDIVARTIVIREKE
jgi:uncharacterized RDD family membrane protein YckC